MPFVKLDCGILNSTLWFEREAREVFITALLMAEPHELLDPAPQIQVTSLDLTGWSVPPGWYGFVPAAGVGIIDRAKVDQEAGIAALEQLGSPEASSRSQDFDGRRLVRIDGGYIVLNYIKYRDKDATAAIRQRRFRERQKEKALRATLTPSRIDRNHSRVQSTEADLVQPEDTGADVAWEQWRQAWEADGRTPLPLTPKPREGQHCIAFATRYPEPEWRALMLSAFFVWDDPQVRKSPPSLGWFVSTWMDEIDKKLRNAGKRPKAVA